MMIHGIVFAGPMYNLMYRFINPFYVRQITKFFPWWTKNFTNWKRGLTGTVVDLTFFNIPITTASISVLGMI
jgi:hypothetical protein